MNSTRLNRIWLLSSPIAPVKFTASSTKLSQGKDLAGMNKGFKSESRNPRRIQGPSLSISLSFVKKRTRF